jgi:DNA-binding LacI/PurR family transcriptional regulator
LEPEDISLLGYDDTDPMPDHMGRNMLTTVTIPLVERGRIGAEKIIRLVGQHSSEIEHTVVPVQSKVRG